LAKGPTGIDTWVKAAGMLLTFLSLRAAFNTIRASEGTLPPSEQTILLRSINRQLARIAPPEEPVSGIDYNEFL
jgi:hypothetical protein